MTTELKRLISMATSEAGGAHPCEVLGHKWVSIGGCNAACSDDCGCSVPVNECEVCGDCDYGDNNDARETREECALLNASQ